MVHNVYIWTPEQSNSCMPGCSTDKKLICYSHLHNFVKPNFFECVTTWAFPQPNKPDKAAITKGRHIAFSSFSFLYPLDCCPKKRNLWKGEQSYDWDIYTPYISEPLLDFVKIKWWICSNNSIYIFEVSFKNWWPTCVLSERIPYLAKFLIVSKDLGH